MKKLPFLQNYSIPDEEIFFKDSENAPIALTVFDDTNSVTLTNHATKDSFEFKVPSCVHKVEIEHNTSHEASAGSNKAKIHIDLDDSSKDYYINEKHGNDNVVIVTNKYGMQLKNVLSLIVEIPFGIVKLINLLHSSKALLPIFETVLGIDIFDKLLQW